MHETWDGNRAEAFREWREELTNRRKRKRCGCCNALQHRSLGERQDIRAAEHAITLLHWADRFAKYLSTVTPLVWGPYACSSDNDCFTVALSRDVPGGYIEIDIQWIGRWWIGRRIKPRITIGYHPSCDDETGQDYELMVLVDRQYTRNFLNCSGVVDALMGHYEAPLIPYGTL